MDNKDKAPESQKKAIDPKKLVEIIEDTLEDVVGGYGDAAEAYPLRMSGVE